MQPLQVTDRLTDLDDTLDNSFSSVPQITVTPDAVEEPPQEYPYCSDVITAMIRENFDPIELEAETPLLDEKAFAEMKAIPDSAFTVKNARLFLTYARADLDKSKLESFLKEVCKKQCPQTHMYIARESHIDGAKHMHVAIEFRDAACKPKAFQSKNVRIFDHEGHHPNIRVIRDLIHWANVRVYLGKEDSSCKPSPSVEACAKIWSKATLAEVAMSEISGMDMREKTAIFAAKPKMVHRSIPEPQGWWIQEILIPILRGESDGRSWHWFCDYKGKVKKSLTCKHFFSQYMSGECMDVLVLDLDMKLDSLCNQLANEQQNGWTGKALLTDLMRQQEDSADFYTNIEKIANGFGSSGKYNGSKFLLANDPIVVVFANWWPKLIQDNGTESASSDRWKFYYIEQDLSARVLNLNEVEAERSSRDELKEIRKLKLRKARREAAGCDYPSYRR